MPGSSSEQIPLQEQLNLEALQEAARNDEWDKVDAALPAVANDATILGWAQKNGLDDTEYRLRDLAVSMLEKASAPLSNDNIVRLKELMATEDENIYVRFRSAFALCRHGVQGDKVMAKLHEALGDPDVGEIARGYLSRFK